MTVEQLELAVDAVLEEEILLPQATPFVKWVGGKRSIMESLVKAMPLEFDRYFEPFVGGGALFFDQSPRLDNAFLSDTNFDLIMTYKVIQKEVYDLIDLLRVHKKKHSKEYYYKVRGQHVLDDPVKIAARFIYLNRTCFNGLWRVNSKGEFNVPIGRYKNPNIVQQENLLSCSQALRDTDIKWQEYNHIEAEADDFVYFDPPYHPTDDASFTKYSKNDFSEHDQIALRDFALKLARNGVKVMLSNSDTKFIRQLYSDKVFRIGQVQAPRLVNCKPNGRGNVSEVLITTYDA